MRGLRSAEGLSSSVAYFRPYEDALAGLPLADARMLAVWLAEAAKHLGGMVEAEIASDKAFEAVREQGRQIAVKIVQAEAAFAETVGRAVAEQVATALRNVRWPAVV